MATKKTEVGIVFKVINKASVPLQKIHRHFREVSEGYNRFTTGAKRATEALVSRYRASMAVAKRAWGFTRKWGGAAAAAGAGMIYAAKRYSAAYDSIGKLSSRIGASTDDIQAWQLASKYAGGSAEDISGILESLYSDMTKASLRTGDMAQKFADLGVAVVDSDNKLRPVMDVMEELASRIRSVEDAALQAELAERIFGGAGRKLILMFKEGKAPAEATAKAIGGFVTEENIRDMEEFTDAVTELGTAFSTLWQSAAGGLTPVVKGLTSLIGGIRKGTGAISAIGRGVVKGVSSTIGGAGKIVGAIGGSPPALGAGTAGVDQQLLQSMLAAAKQGTGVDIRLNINAPEGMTATVESMKKKGSANVKLNTSGYLGPT